MWTDHKNIIQDALGLTLDRVYRWRLLLEDDGPGIEYIKSVNNTVADAISHFEYNPEVNPSRSRWIGEHGVNAKHLKMKALSKNFSLYHEACSHAESGEEHSSASKHETVSEATRFVFANHSEEEEIYSLTVLEIADQQRTDPSLSECL